MVFREPGHDRRPLHAVPQPDRLGGPGRRPTPRDDAAQATTSSAPPRPRPPRRPTPVTPHPRRLNPRNSAAPSRPRQRLRSRRPRHQPTPPQPPATRSAATRPVQPPQPPPPPVTAVAAAAVPPSRSAKGDRPPPPPPQLCHAASALAVAAAASPPQPASAGSPPVAAKPVRTAELVAEFRTLHERALALVTGHRPGTSPEPRRADGLGDELCRRGEAERGLDRCVEALGASPYLLSGGSPRSSSSRVRSRWCSKWTGPAGCCHRAWPGPRGRPSWTWASSASSAAPPCPASRRT